MRGPGKRKISPGRKIQVGGEGMRSMEYCPSIFLYFSRSHGRRRPVTAADVCAEVSASGSRPLEETPRFRAL